MKRCLAALSSLAAVFALAGCDMPPSASQPEAAAAAPEHPVLSAPETGKACVGLIDIEIKQSSFTLDPIEHIKNNANATRMRIAALPSDYARMQEGQELQSDFRSGSFWLNGGEISSRDITVTRKVGFVCE